MSEKKYKKNITVKTVKEPELKYDTLFQKKKITIFKSHEEADEKHYEYLASLTPEVHLQNAVSWIKRLYADELKKHPRIGKKLHFD